MNSYKVYNSNSIKKQQKPYKDGTYREFAFEFTTGKYSNNVSLTSLYNIYIHNFESRFKNSKIQNLELVIPSHYWTTTNNQNLLSYFGYLQNTEKLEEKATNGQYFEEVSEILRDNVVQISKDIILSGKYDKFYIDKNILKNSKSLHKSFPAYCEIKFKTNNFNKTVAKTLDEIGLLDDFCYFIAARDNPKILDGDLFRETVIEKFENTEEGYIKTNKNSIVKVGPRQTVDIPDTAQKIQEAVFQNKQSTLLEITANQNTRTSITLQTSLKLKKALDNSFDSKDISQDKPEFANIFMYQILKYKMISNNKVLVQKFYVPNFSEEFSFIDTQVMEGNSYHYEIQAHIITLASEISVKNGKETSVFNNFFTIKIPWYNTEEFEGDFYQILSIKNNPPLSPELDILPFERMDNKVQISIKNRYGNELLNPIIIKDSDIRNFKENADFIVYDSIINPDNVENDFVLFRTDEFSGFAELYMLNERPETYRDFSNNLLQTIPFLQQKTVILDVEPNKDYYFCSRIIDIHGNISNPTNIFKIRLISVDDSLPYFTKEIINLKEKDKKYNRKFKKYILIRPSEFQSTLNDRVNEPEMIGTIFGKKYLFELESTKTGRKIDFVVKVNVPERVIDKKGD